MANDEKPAVLIVGGMGYIGRCLALHILNANLASELRLVDKVLPQLARLSPECEAANLKKYFLQADACRQQFMPKIFDRANGKQFDFVFNCGGETRFSQDDDVYRTRSYDLAVAMGKEAAKRDISCYIEVSTGQVYKPAESPRKETDKIKPWTKLAKWKLSATEEMAKIDGLNMVILRVANVYGPYCHGFMGTGLCLARVYQEMGQEMKWLWDKNLMTNTVHIDDTARALWAAAVWYSDTGQAEKGNAGPPIFNIVDHNRTSQGTMADLFGSVFNIKTGFQGKLVSEFAKLNIDSVVEDVNDETLDEWAELQKRSEVQEGYITPFMEAELLKDTDLSLDGSRFEKTTGFKYTKERMGKAEIKEVIDSYKRMNWWP
ncbi:MAG: hypothetical protein Q9159_000583 [Coniocarpon cinnabarinum]